MIKKVMLVALLGVFVASCGGDNKKKKASEATVVQTEQKQEEKQVSSNPNEAVVVLESNDAMKYNLKEIRVKEGQKVTLTLKHVGKMSKEMMGHNFVLLTSGADVAKIAQEAANAKSTDYIPVNSKEIIAYTKMIGGGESTTVVFDAPQKGVYPFFCSFPGHYSMMKGEFIVE
ncbi:azurin [Capnocytophaga canimorsus]|uniref:azurin n=1 Tax=Capnocytophaga canimorsus TaxID=28188 RepID=UPI0037D79E28